MDEAKSGHVGGGMIMQPSAQLGAQIKPTGPTIDYSLSGLQDANQHLQDSVNRLIALCSQIDGEDPAIGQPDASRPVTSGQRHILAEKAQETARLAQQIDQLLGRLSESLG